MTMWKRRFAWLVIVLAALVMYLLENNGGTRILLISVVVLPLCSALTLLPRPKLTVRLSFPETLARGESARCRLILSNSSLFPLAHVQCEVRVQNELTGERLTLPATASVGGKQAAEVPFNLTCAHCGQLSVRLSGLQVLDLFGLFARKLPCTAEQILTVPPAVSPVAVSLADAADFLQDSQRYSTQHPGYDPSETFRIREYVPGDPIRQIHWKLSQKTEATMVRDFGLPVVSQLLILLESASIPGGEVTPEDMDQMLDMLFSLSQSLLALDVPHTVGWQELSTGAYREQDIQSPENWPELQAILLTNPMGPAPADVVSAYLQDHVQCAYAHVVVLSPYPSPVLSGLFRGNRVAVLSPAGENRFFDAPGATVTSFNADELRTGNLSLEL